MAFDQNKPANSASLASVDIRNNFQHLKNALMKEHNWNDADPNLTTHNLDIISVSLTGSTQANVTTGGSLTKTGTGSGSVNVLNQATGIASGSYTIRNILQQLVNRSHTHGTSAITYNCNCNCSDGE